MRTLTRIAAAAAAGMLSLGAFTPAAQAGDSPKMIKCDLEFTLNGWSAFYKTAEGDGTIICNDGQRIPVKLDVKAGGVTFGKSTVTDGYGNFTEVARVDDLFGRYIVAGAEAGAGKSGEASVVTKGDISLALSAKGTGVNLGISFGRFKIKRA
jgi:hypothetical protein